MKLLATAALVMATSLPLVPAVAGGMEASSTDRRICTQVSVRAGSRMSGRRVCRTPTEWREALGPDWRQHLAGARGVQDDYEAMQAYMTPGGETGGVRPQAGGGLVGRAAAGGGPR